MVDYGNDIVAQIMRAQEEGTPLKTYRKAIVGKIVVRIIDPYSGGQGELLLEGVPGKVDPVDIEVSLWTPLEVSFFERFNRGLIENGSIVLADQKSEYSVNMRNALSDEDLEGVVTARFFSLLKTLEQVTSETTAQRILKKAEELNRPAKTLSAIKERIEELQQGE